jgi:oxygen-independent coproporphyrinogen-3 oxidase
VTEAGLYVHVPFCLTRCGYCDFNAYAGLDHLKAPYVRALAAEAALVSGAWEGMPFASIFVGGGTPTTLPAADLASLLRTLAGAFSLAPDAEITVEANPDTVDETYLRALRGTGVTRLSFGLQSFDPAVLAALERVHTAEAAVEAFRAARRVGFDDVNLDLIYGAHAETIASWKDTLARTIDLQPDHVSAYALTVEPSTMLGRNVASGKTPAPDPDRQAEMYDAACAMLGAAGLVHYEVSNWARPGRESVHNRGYWEDRPYLGLGAGAHSHRGDERWWNVKPPTAYLEAVARGLAPVGGRERVEADERRLERLLLGLRTSHGVPTVWVPEGVVERYAALDLGHAHGERFVLSERGMLLANQAVLDIDGASVAQAVG